CWAGVKWTSVRQRIENKNGNNPSYVGVPLQFTKTEFIKWILDNPPPKHLVEPSLDRIVDEIGYAPGNIRWIEKRANSRGRWKDLPPDLQHCALCGEDKPATTEYFVANRAKPSGIGSYCRPCNAIYQRKWFRNRWAYG